MPGVRGIFDLDQLLTFTRTCVLEAFSQRIGMLISTKYAAIRNSTILENVLSKLETVLSVHRTLLHRVFPTCCQSRLLRCSLISESYGEICVWYDWHPQNTHIVTRKRSFTKREERSTKVWIVNSSLLLPSSLALRL